MVRETRAIDHCFARKGQISGTSLHSYPVHFIGFNNFRYSRLPLFELLEVVNITYRFQIVQGSNKSETLS